MATTQKRLSRAKRIDNVVMNCYRELFANSTPVGDFDKMMAEADKNEFGQLVIPFMDYELEEEKFEEIVQKHMDDKSIKLTPYEKRGFSVSIHLGCSPKFKSKSL